MQTIEDSKNQEAAEKKRLKFASPEELEKIHEQHKQDFEMGQDLNLLAASDDINNLQVRISSWAYTIIHILKEWMSLIWASSKVISRQTSKGDIQKTFVTNRPNLRGNFKLNSNLIQSHLRF